MNEKGRDSIKYNKIKLLFFSIFENNNNNLQSKGIKYINRNSKYKVTSI